MRTVMASATRALADSLDPAFVLITGDRVKDALRVGEPEATGNHENVDMPPPC